MDVTVFTTPGRVKDDELRGRTGVVIDVLRASSTIAAALAGGCREVLPQSGMEEAARLRQRLDRDLTVIAGERGGTMIEGYDLGNSPLDFTPERVGGKSVILTTTNGSGAMVKTRVCRRSVIASFLNVSATAGWLARRDGNLVIICSGREERFSQEDTVCAGMLISLIARQRDDLVPDDAARAAQLLYRHYAEDLPGMMAEADHGRYLKTMGFGDDVAYCARTDLFPDVLTYRDGRITVLRESRQAAAR